MAHRYPKPNAVRSQTNETENHSNGGDVMQTGLGIGVVDLLTQQSHDRGCLSNSEPVDRFDPLVIGGRPAPTRRVSGRVRDPR